MGFCGQCQYWRFEANVQFQSPDEQDGFGLCERAEEMKANPLRAVVRCDDEFANIQTRNEYGCVLFENKY